MDKKIIIGLIGAFIAVILIGVVILSLPEQEKGDNLTPIVEASASIDENKFDWGEIGINDGNVENIFEIKNEGTKPLTLYSVYTSCMCTTAQLILDEQESPLFGMHDNSNYIMEVSPGKTATLKVVFDPAFHGPEETGAITRQINIKTNDINNPELIFTLTADVIK